MKLLIAGDFCQRYRIDKESLHHNYDLIFGAIKPYIESADYSILNYEFPIILNEYSAEPIPKCGPNLRGTIDAIKAVRYAGFKCCTLANNHILDQGEQCCIDTKNIIEQAGLDSVGVGRNLTEAGRVLYKVINGETLAIINCCEHEFSIAEESKAGANPLNPIRQYYAIREARQLADYVVVIIHGGHEYFQLPSLRMQETYRFFVDVGADAVINHHQHCYSGYEIYKEKPIFYGLGNFCFDHVTERTSQWNEGYMVIVNLIKSSKIQYELIPYTQCSEELAVVPLKPEKLREFDKRISELNEIISDELILREEVLRYYDSCVDFELRLLEPYDNILLSKLYRIGLLPKIFKGVKKYSIMNHIFCESHLDKLRHALKR